MQAVALICCHYKADSADDPINKHDKDAGYIALDLVANPKPLGNGTFDSDGDGGDDCPHDHHDHASCRTGGGCRHGRLGVVSVLASAGDRRTCSDHDDYADYLHQGDTFFKEEV